MKKILIIGASVLQLPAILRAKELGFYVGVADYNPNAVGIPYADEYFNVSTVDTEGVTACAREFAPDGIFTLATDMPMRSVAAAGKALSLPAITPETALRATDKGEMIRAFAEHGVEHPWFFVVSSLEEARSLKSKISYPCICKPTDSSGSRGVMLIKNGEELMESLAYSAGSGRSGTVIVEEYLKGHEVSVEVIVLRGMPHILQVTDKLTTGAPHFVEMGHSQPSRLPEADLERIRDLASRAVLAVGIENGPAHVEIMLTEQGPRMIELGARMGGDCITTHLVPLSTGIDMVEASMRIALGEEPDIAPKKQRGSAIRFFDVPFGTIESIEGIEAARATPGVTEVTFTKAVGDTAGEIGSSTDRVGFVIAEAETAEAAVAICEKALKTVKITVK